MLLAVSAATDLPTHANNLAAISTEHQLQMQTLASISACGGGYEQVHSHMLHVTAATYAYSSS